MAVFTCVLKEDRAGMKKGTTIQVSSSFSTVAQYEIKEVLERQFGKRAGDASFPGYWNIKKN